MTFSKRMPALRIFKFRAFGASVISGSTARVSSAEVILPKMQGNVIITPGKGKGQMRNGHEQRVGINEVGYVDNVFFQHVD